MKSEKGITMVSLIIYVIAMLVTITIITIVTSYFYKNVDITSDRYTYFSEFTKFESYISEEVNKTDNQIIDIGQVTENDKTQNFVVFSSGNQYTYIPENQAIYQNNVKIASGVESCLFKEKFVNGKQAIEIQIKIQDKIRTVQYVLKNW